MSVKVLRPTAVVVSVDDPNDTLPSQGSLCLMTKHYMCISSVPFTIHNLGQIEKAILALEFLLGLT